MAASTALAVDRRGSIAGSDTLGMRRVGLVRPTSNPAEVIEAHKEIAAMVAEVLEDGVDYGEIPGTEGKKALFKAGAERLAFSVGASLELEVLEREIDHDREVPWTKTKWTGPKGNRKAIESHGLARGLYRYVVKCRLVRREDGAVLGEGIGSCSTMESKYIDRPRDTENTVLKMAKKRASVDAVLSTLALTGRFAPDEPEDDGTDDDGVVEDPTDGLTLAQALAFQLNGVAIGEMRAKALSNAMQWITGKLFESPDDARLRRIGAMIEMVHAHRETNPLPPKEPPAAAPAPTPTPEADADAPDPAGLDLPF